MKKHLPFILLAALFLFFYVGAELGYSGWLYTYTITLNLADPASAAYLNSAFWFSFTLGRLLSVALAARYSPKVIIPWSLSVTLLALLPALFLPGSLTALWATTLGMGFFMAPIFPTGVTLVGQSVPLNARITGLVFLGDSLGGMVLPGVLGKVIELAGARMMVFLVFASLVMNGIVFILLIRRRKAAILKTGVDPNLQST